MEELLNVEEENQFSCEHWRLPHRILENDGPNGTSNHCSSERYLKIEKSRARQEKWSHHCEYFGKLLDQNVKVIAMYLSEFPVSFLRNCRQHNLVQYHGITGQNAHKSSELILTVSETSINTRDLHQFSENLQLADASSSYYFSDVFHSYSKSENDVFDFRPQSFSLEWANNIQYGTITTKSKNKADHYPDKYSKHEYILILIRLASNNSTQIINGKMTEYNEDTKAEKRNLFRFPKITSVYIVIATRKSSKISYRSNDKFFSRCMFRGRIQPLNNQSENSKTEYVLTNGSHVIDKNTTQMQHFTKLNDEHLISFNYIQVNKTNDSSDRDVKFQHRFTVNLRINLPSAIRIRPFLQHHLETDKSLTKYDNPPNSVISNNVNGIVKVIKFLLCNTYNSIPDVVIAELKILVTSLPTDGDYMNLMKKSKRTWFKLVKILLKHSVNVNLIDDEGNSLLHYLSFEKFWPDKSEMDRLAQKLIKAGAKVDKKNKFGLTPLHCAVIGGYKKIVDVLLKYGANVNSITNENFFTPIHFAAMNSYLIDRDFPIIDSLIKNRANLEARTNDGKTVLHQLITKKIMYSEFVQDENPWQVYFLIKYFLNIGCNVNAKNVKGQTPLHLACELDCEKTVYELLQHGADVNAEDYSGQPPLLYRKEEWTASRNILALHVIKLLSAGFDVSKKNKIECSRLAETHKYLLEVTEFAVQKRAREKNFDRFRRKHFAIGNRIDIA
ncbi:hypothetical protein QAD02_006158 [Eretmocerus hayati]|uniref:Uncharacterized protein n=1 Tax=Eretmocerus hayati TaxID=131215 RepID=A0ACC2N199_9HYME|nr:hypothetical protein QAD02_006158 [Eretmocerus hayati]